MKLVQNAGSVSLKSYSMWANYLGILGLITPEALYFLAEIDTNPRMWWIIALSLIIGGSVGRVVDQGISKKAESPLGVLLVALLLVLAPAPSKASPVTVDQFLSEAIPLVAKWEGKKNTAYLDRIASPPVWTVCYGETRGVTRGDTYSDAECADVLGKGLLEFRRGLHRAFVPATLQTRLTPKRDAAYVSLAYNAGVHAISRSTAVRRLNAGHIAGGCKALTWWNRAGNRVVRGLVNRRADEYRLCMIGVA